MAMCQKEDTLLLLFLDFGIGIIFLMLGSYGNFP